MTDRMSWNSLDMAAGDHTGAMTAARKPLSRRWIDAPNGPAGSMVTIGGLTGVEAGAKLVITSFALVDSKGTPMSTATAPPRPLALLGLAATTIAAGAIVGGATNAINGAVSDAYFRGVMRWEDVDDVWRASVAMGIFSGLMYGVFAAVVLTLVVGVVSRAQCPYAFAARQMFAIVVGVLVCWAVGGLIGLGLAALSPEFFRRTFLAVPESAGEMLRYAWVGGSIMGAMTGGVLALVIGCILFTARWRRAHPRERSR
jgi:hypothetical protein